MIKYKKNCKICQLIKANPKLKDRIYRSSYFVPEGYESLSAISEDYVGQFGLNSLYNHVKKHQTVTAGRRAQKTMTLIAKKAQKQQEDLESAAGLPTLDENGVVDVLATPVMPKNPGYEDVWNEVLAVASEQLRNGNMKLTAANMLTAARDKSVYEDKKKDRQLAMLQMIAHFTSGENAMAGERSLNADHQRRHIAAA